jgi:RHS repeat-associated protein
MLTGGTSSGTGEIQQTFSYDAFGNLKQSGSFNFQQTYNANNQISSGGYSYDAAGRASTDGLGNTFTFDVPGHMVSSGGNASASYVYDAADRRIEKSDGGDTKEYMYFGGKLMAIYQVSTSSWTDLIYANGAVLAEVAGTASATPSYRVSDNLQSVAGLLNASGALTGTAQYAPFGEQISNGTGDIFGFTGLESDSVETGLNYAGARYYTPAAGRWLSPDPDSSSYDWSNPQSLNRYAYVNNNPLGFRDPSGQSGECMAEVAAALGVAPATEGASVGVVVGDCIADAIITALMKYLQDLLEGQLDNDRNADILRTTPRPTASGGFWDENLGLPAGLNPHPPGLAALLGLPSGDDCDFGACGVGGSSFLEGQTSSPQSQFPQVPDAVWVWAATQTTKAHGKWTYGNWCGYGGAGIPIDDVDAACMMHDYCYDTNHVSAAEGESGVLSGLTASVLQQCNQLLCNAVNHSYGWNDEDQNAQEILSYFSHWSQLNRSVRCK